uniref:Uncharacterized protein n=1 Tax=Kalanchoe fedtschenkoi TaxID=63787 RepID=A0A7N0UTU5_KALFE
MINYCGNQDLLEHLTDGHRIRFHQLLNDSKLSLFSSSPPSTQHPPSLPHPSVFTKHTHRLYPISLLLLSYASPNPATGPPDAATSSASTTSPTPPSSLCAHCISKIRRIPSTVAANAPPDSPPPFPLQSDPKGNPIQLRSARSGP